MNENISRLMDGEVDAAEFDCVCAELKSPSAMATWVCYHVIGDPLRGAPRVSRADSRRASARRWRPSRRCWRRVRVVARRAPAHVGLGGRGHARRGHRRRLDRLSMVDAPPAGCRQGARGGDGARRAGQAVDRSRRLPARAPGILAGDGDAGRRAVPARRGRRPAADRPRRRPNERARCVALRRSMQRALRSTRSSPAGSLRPCLLLALVATGARADDAMQWLARAAQAARDARTTSARSSTSTARTSRRRGSRTCSRTARSSRSS